MPFRFLGPKIYPLASGRPFVIILLHVSGRSEEICGPADEPQLRPPSGAPSGQHSKRLVVNIRVIGSVCGLSMAAVNVAHGSNFFGGVSLFMSSAFIIKDAHLLLPDDLAKSVKKDSSELKATRRRRAS